MTSFCGVIEFNCAKNFAFLGLQIDSSHTKVPNNMSRQLLSTISCVSGLSNDHTKLGRWFYSDNDFLKENHVSIQQLI